MESAADAGGGVTVSLKLFGVVSAGTTAVTVPPPFTLTTLAASVAKSMKIASGGFELVASGKLLSCPGVLDQVRHGAPVTVVPKNRSGHQVGQHSTAGRAIGGSATATGLKEVGEKLNEVKRELEKLPEGKGKLSMVIQGPDGTTKRLDMDSKRAVTMLDMLGSGNGTPKDILNALSAVGGDGGGGGGASAAKDEDMPGMLAMANHRGEELTAEERKSICEKHDRYIAGVKNKKQDHKRKVVENETTSSTLAMLHQKRAALKERKERRKAARNASKNVGCGGASTSAAGPATIPASSRAGKTVKKVQIKAAKAAVKASSSKMHKSSAFGGLKKGFLL